MYRRPVVPLCTAGLMVSQVFTLAVHRSHALFSGNMESNTTAPAADTVWMNVGAVRGAAPELDFQLLEFSQRMSLVRSAAGGGSTATRRVRNLRRVKNLVQSLNRVGSMLMWS